MFWDSFWLFAALAAIAILAWQFYNVAFRGVAPYISSRPETIRAVMDKLGAFNLPEDPDFYELGCGRAGFLRSAEERWPKGKFTGIDNSIWVYLTARTQKALSKSRIDLKYGNLFRLDLRSAEVIYCFLERDVMVKLEKKLGSELAAGAIVISNHNELPGRTPVDTIVVDEDKLFIYKF